MALGGRWEKTKSRFKECDGLHFRSKDIQSARHVKARSNPIEMRNGRVSSPSRPFLSTLAPFAAAAAVGRTLRVEASVFTPEDKYFCLIESFSADQALHCEGSGHGRRANQLFDDESWDELDVNSAAVKTREKI